MALRKRAAEVAGDAEAPVAKRRSSRQAAAAAVSASAPKSSAVASKAKSNGPSKPAAPPKKTANSKTSADSKPKPAPTKPTKKEKAAPAAKEEKGDQTATAGSRAVSPDVDPADIPVHNPEAVKHEGKWYWLMKAEPESRFENGHDVRFSIDDLRACTKPEGWDGIRAYAARNNLRAMNAGDMAFFYHSNCKIPGIVGTMEIVREFSEDKSARRPGTPYYDPSSSKDKIRWSLVHVEFRRKFAVPIPLPELRGLGQAGGPLAEMQMLKQSRLSVSRVSEGEWKVLCELADEKAKDAGLEHEDKYGAVI